MQGEGEITNEWLTSNKGGGGWERDKNHSTHIQEPRSGSKMTSQESYGNIVIKLKNPVTLKM